VVHVVVVSYIAHYINLLNTSFRDRRDHMVVGFTTTYEISEYHH